MNWTWKKIIIKITTLEEKSLFFCTGCRGEFLIFIDNLN